MLPRGFESFPSGLPRARWHNLMRAEYSSVLNLRGGGSNKEGWVGSQHKFLKVAGGGHNNLRQAIILLVKWVGGNLGEGGCSNFEYRTGRSLE